MNKTSLNALNTIDLDESDINESTGYRPLDNKEIDQLYVSYHLMKKFTEKISFEQNFNLPQILQKYADRPLQFELLPKNVMHILDKRIQRMLKNKKLKKNWSSQDTEILCWTFSHYCHLNQIKTVEQATLDDWQNISKLIPGSSADGCMFKILSFKKIKLANKKWTEDQSQLLLQIAANSNRRNWRNIAQELYKRNPSGTKIFRNAKQCKEHWVCYLNPQLRKGSWSLEEDKKLMQHIFQNNGSRKWAQIARVFGGRTQNALKNRYTLIIERLKRQKNSEDDLQMIKSYLEKIQEMQQMQQRKKIAKEQRKMNSHKFKGETKQQSQKPVQESQEKQKQKIAYKQARKENQADLQGNIVIQSINKVENGEIPGVVVPLSGQNMAQIAPISIQCFPIFDGNNQIFLFFPSFDMSQQR